MHAHRTLSNSRLVRLLGEWASLDVETPRQDFAERLSGWLTAFDTVRLEAALQSIQAFARQGGATSRDLPLALDEFYQRAREALTAGFTLPEPRTAVDKRLRDRLPVEVQNVDDVDYGNYFQAYLDHQRRFELKISQLRGQVRQVLSRGSSALRQLAAMDAVMEQMLGAREQKLLATVPVYLERRFESRRQAHKAWLTATQAEDDPKTWRQPGAWLHGFQQDWRDILTADMTARLLPVVGLIEAYQNEIQARSE